MLFVRMLRPLIRSGGLTVIDPGGRSHHIGQTGHGEAADEPALVIRITTSGADWCLATHLGLAAGEAYMDGTLVVERGSLYQFLELVTSNLGTAAPPRLAGLARVATGMQRLWQQRNPVGLARRNVAHHYDLSTALYDLFLDHDRQYSCAYFRHPGMGLEAAQTAKKRHIAAKLRLRPGQRVLDIGCGWGGLALHLASVADVEVQGITLSQEQLRESRRRAAAAGLDDRVRFDLLDYRQVQGRFDRIVSVGMFEHVGVPNYGAYFDGIRRLLSDDGVALLHSIGRRDEPGTTNPWLRRYIFPGGYSPALSEVFPAVERADLWVTDLEVWRLHYAETLRHWRERFLANREKAAALYDERFCRMWEFYLAGCECAFRFQGHMVFQMQLARQAEALPLTRDYMHETELALERTGHIAAE